MRFFSAAECKVRRRRIVRPQRDVDVSLCVSVCKIKKKQANCERAKRQETKKRTVSSNQTGTWAHRVVWGKAECVKQTKDARAACNVLKSNNSPPVEEEAG